jgi:diguanylate cyclase (GGDEF)-like protein
MAALSFSLAHGTPRHGLTEWGKAMSCAAAGFLLFFFRGHAPLFLTYLVANALIMAVITYYLIAYARLLEVAKPAIAFGAAFGMSGVLIVYFFDASNRVAIFTVSLAIALELGVVIAMILRSMATQTPKLAWISIAAMGVMAATFSARAVLSLLIHTPSLLPAGYTTPQIAALVIGGLFFALSTVGFVSMVNERQRRETVGRLNRDGLTGLFTRTAFFEMAAEINSFGDYAVVMFDMDHFKTVNDRFGHAGGDAVLAHAARLIASSIRISDTAARYGGEEFCVLLRSCSEREAANFADRLVNEARRQTVRLRDGRSVSFTISAGYAFKPSGSSKQQVTETLDDVIERADQALYRAKDGGRNQAVSAHFPNLSVTG